MRRYIQSRTAFTLTLIALCLTGCTAAKLGTTLGKATGHISDEQADSINRSADALEKTFADITPEQEYYIGRAVAATVFKSYKPLTDKGANDYLNLLGQTIALASDRPETFGGYHFQLLDSDEINAFAAPGGLIMVTRGMVECCADEDALAAVLAHEIAHVAGRHGLQAIKKARLTSALTILAVEGSKNFGGKDLAELTEAYEGSILDITSTMMNSGYARQLENEADAAAVATLKRLGYPPASLIRMLGEMDKRLEPGGLDFAKTHPDPADRIKDLRPAIGSGNAPPVPPAREARFTRALARL